jgi:hypothetical protein
MTEERGQENFKLAFNIFFSKDKIETFLAFYFSVHISSKQPKVYFCRCSLFVHVANRLYCEYELVSNFTEVNAPNCCTCLRWANWHMYLFLRGSDSSPGKGLSTKRTSLSFASVRLEISHKRGKGFFREFDGWLWGYTEWKTILRGWRWRRVIPFNL